MKPETRSVGRPPRRKVWHREDIKAELRKRYGTLCALSTGWGMNAQAITHTLLRPHHHKPTARRIAAALDLSPHDLWPSVFQPETCSVSAGRKPNRRSGDREQQKIGQEVA
jgi:Ner family transcriptional regulator